MADLLTGWRTLFQNVNRVKSVNSEDSEGVQGDLVPELSLDIDEERLISLKNSWLKDWREINATLSKKQEVNENYWKGKFTYSEIQQQSTDRPEADNLIFESVETALPMFTKANPEPVVECDDEGQKNDLQNKIKTIADEIKYKLKLRGTTRNWALFYVGAGKIVYDAKYDRIDFKVIRPQKLILDPKANVEGGVYLGEYIGEYKTEKARDIITKYPKAKTIIEEAVKNNLATKITYVEWWTDEYVFWTFEDKVLDKIKNPHWNYDTEQEQQEVNEFGDVEIKKVPVKGVNQLPFPQKPYTFLTVFNLGKQPYDETSLVEQNLYLQDLVHKRLKQIDANIDNINGGYIVSGDSGLTKEQAQEAISAIRKGGAIYMKGGNPNNVYAKVNSEGLSQDVYQSLQDYRTELRNVFGTRGSSAQGVATEQTVRGKIIIGQKDESRGGMIAEYLEQLADYTFNWFVQMMYVYYEGFAQQYPNKALISVKEGSLIPKDSMTKRNEAIDLFGMGAISNLDLYKALELPNPDELNANLMQWRMEQSNPMAGMQQQQPMSPEQAQSQQIMQQVPPQQ